MPGDVQQARDHAGLLLRPVLAKDGDMNLPAPASLQTSLKPFAELNRSLWQIACETQAVRQDRGWASTPR